MLRKFDSVACMLDVKICDLRVHVEEHTWKWKHWTYIVSQDDSIGEWENTNAWNMEDAHKDLAPFKLGPRE